MALLFFIKVMEEKAKGEGERGGMKKYLILCMIYYYILKF
jgi:hypothetical protein